MNRRLLPVFGAALLGACVLPVLADATATSTPVNDGATRVQVEQKRDHASGADTLSTPKKTGPAAVLDAPVVTDDAPAQVQAP
jgi:hypothetical protein